MSFHWWHLTVTVTAEIQTADAWGQLCSFTATKKILFAHLKYHESATRFIPVLISQSGKGEVRSCGMAWGLPAFSLEESWCQPAVVLLWTPESAGLLFRGGSALWSVERVHWATAGTDEVWFECWAEKKIDWMVDIDSSKSTSKGWLLSLCWHMCYGCRFMLVR